MKIKKRSGEFRGHNWCCKAREYDELHLESKKNKYYDNAIIVKEIIRGYLKGDYQVSEFPDLVSQGVEDDYLTEKAGEARRNQLVKCLERACLSEHRQASFPNPMEMEFGDYLVTVKPDAVFHDAGTLEVVLYRAGKPNVTMKGEKENSVMQCLELYFLLQYGRKLIPDGECQNVRASYYFLRKSTDKTAGPWDSEFFTGKGGNVVFLEQMYLGGDHTDTPLDIHFMNLLEQYSIGRECTDDDCKACMWNVVCNYVKSPELFEEKGDSSKKGKIIPTETQQEIIDFRKGVCRVNAAAGSGKTECMTERGARMLEEGVAPSEMLFITFTNAGAKEIKDRISKKCKVRGLPIKGHDIQAMTFNTFAYQIVKENYVDCGFSKPPIVIDDVRNSVIVTQLLDESPVDGLDYLNYEMNTPNCRGALACAKKVFEVIKTDMIDPEDPEAAEDVRAVLSEDGYCRFMSDGSIQSLVNLYKQYDQRLKEDNLLQFADQEPLMFHVLEKHPDYLERYGFKHITVDEFQDTNDIQLETIRRLCDCQSFESLMVVGDDSQGIYGFRNTSTDNILNFFEKIGMQGEDLFLTENRRSTPEILDLANKINRLNEDRVEKDMIPVRPAGNKVTVNGFHSKDEEYRYIAGRIKRLIDEGCNPEDIAFIAFKKSELIALGAELSRIGIPWVMKNPLPLMENSKVKAALSLAEAFYQPESEQLYFNYLTAKYDGEIFSRGTLDDIREEILELKHTFQNIDLLDMGYQRQLFHTMLDEIKGDDEIYQYFLELIYENEDLQSELEYIVNFTRFGESTAKKMEQSYRGVILTTAHSSKGLEWKAVFNSITNYDRKDLHGGGQKRKAKVEEMRRLLFVSVTRARNLLYITGQYVAYGPKNDRAYNQFLKEVYDALDVEYVPVDPMEAAKDAERKNKAAARRKKLASTENSMSAMTAEEKAEYARQTKNAFQLTLDDLKIS